MCFPEGSDSDKGPEFESNLMCVLWDCCLFRVTMYCTSKVTVVSQNLFYLKNWFSIFQKNCNSTGITRYGGRGDTVKLFSYSFKISLLISVISETGKFGKLLTVFIDSGQCTFKCYMLHVTFVLDITKEMSIISMLLFTIYKYFIFWDLAFRATS